MVNDVLLISTSLKEGLFLVTIEENVDDDDDMDGGMMIPRITMCGKPQ